MMDNTSSSQDIIANLNASVESLMAEMHLIRLSSIEEWSADFLEKLEIELHKKAGKLADLISAIKFPGGVK